MKNTLRPWLRVLPALFLLNVLLTFHNVWPTPWIWFAAELSIELIVLVLLLAVYAEWIAVPSRALQPWLALGLLVLVLGRYADVTAPALYGRPVNLYWDVRYLPQVTTMMVKVAPVWLVALGAAGLIGALAGLYALLWACLRSLWRGLEHPLARHGLTASAAALTLLFAVSVGQHWPVEHGYASAVTPVYWRQLSFALAAGLGADRTLPSSPTIDSDLGRLHSADVFVIFIESYGATAFDDPRFAAQLKPRYQNLAAAIAESGRGVVSAFVTSPTFGGSSRLAHASLLTGIEVGDDERYQLLLTSNRETLVRRFQAHGYRAVALMPGLRQPWPEGQFYGFDHLYGATDLNYRGPAFGWWRIPDQYSLAKLHALEVAAKPRQPLFVLFPTISSHIPFLPTPVYQPDWKRVLTADPFAPETVAAALAQRPDWLQLGPAYAATLSYELTWLAGYLRGLAQQDTVFIVLGDHQPAASVSGTGARWDVPVHIISAQQPVLTALVAAGFSPGLAPPRAPLAKLSELRQILLNAFHSGTAGQTVNQTVNHPD